MVSIGCVTPEQYHDITHLLPCPSAMPRGGLKAGIILAPHSVINMT